MVSAIRAMFVVGGTVVGAIPMIVFRKQVLQTPIKSVASSTSSSFVKYERMCHSQTEGI